MCQKLIIKHDNLRKLSLLGCSAIDVRLEFYQQQFIQIIDEYGVITNFTYAGFVCEMSRVD
jgi:hypothetical protein